MGLVFRRKQAQALVKSRYEFGTKPAFFWGSQLHILVWLAYGLAEESLHFHCEGLVAGKAVEGFVEDFAVVLKPVIFILC